MATFAEIFNGLLLAPGSRFRFLQLTRYINYLLTFN